MSDTKISKKQALINKIKKDKLITKGLSKLSMKELEKFDKDGLHASDWLETLDDKTAYEKRQKILTLMTKKKLLKIVSATRIKNYSHLTHKDLISLIADKYWGDFHDKWMVVARKDKTLLPDWYYGSDKIRKIGRTKKVKKEEDDKEDDKEVKEPDDDAPLELKQYLDELLLYKNYTIKEMGELEPKYLKETYLYLKNNKKILDKYKIKNKKNWEKILDKIENNMKKVLEDDKKCLTPRQKEILKEATHRLSYFLDKSNLDKNRKKRIERINKSLDNSNTLIKQIDINKCKDTHLYKDFMKVYNKIYNTDEVKNGVWKTIWKDLDIVKDKREAPKKPKKKEEKKKKPEPDEKKDEDAPENTPMTTDEGNKKLKEILSSKAMPKSKLKKVLTDLFSSMKGNPNFYKKNKEIIDKLTSPEFRKRMDFI